MEEVVSAAASYSSQQLVTRRPESCLNEKSFAIQRGSEQSEMSLVLQKLEVFNLSVESPPPPAPSNVLFCLSTEANGLIVSDIRGRVCLVLSMRIRYLWTLVTYLRREVPWSLNQSSDATVSSRNDLIDLTKSCSAFSTSLSQIISYRELAKPEYRAPLLILEQLA